MGHILEGLGWGFFVVSPLPSLPPTYLDGLNVMGGQKEVREATGAAFQREQGTCSLYYGCISIFPVTLLFPGV